MHLQCLSLNSPPQNINLFNENQVEVVAGHFIELFHENMKNLPTLIR